MIYLLWDILIYNFTPYHSYFFLINILQKNWRYLLIVALILDFFLLHTYGFHLIFFMSGYIFLKYGNHLNLNNFLYYFLFNFAIFICYFIFTHILFSYFSYPIFLEAMLLQSIFIVISYNKRPCNINLIG